ncbi:uncharacterized protein [Nicotiana sylvestris]|uniref:uncharacterized protein n=1 Tax=Nicotiana sylvestris TaxID=4096 RepID=UPI00388C49A9
MEGSNRDIVVPGDYDLLSDCDQVASIFAPLCAAPDSEALKTMSDSELSRSVSYMALRTLILEIERERRERMRMTIYGKMSSKYQEYRTKHRAMADIYNQDHDFQLFREGLKQREDQLARKVEELKERDEDLMKAVSHSSELEEALRAREDELELSRGVVAENADLQAKVDSLTAELDLKTAEVDELKGELSMNADRLARAEKERVTAIFEAVVSEDALRVCRLERTKDMETYALKTTKLEGRIQGLEAELSALNRRASEAELWDVRAKARVTHEACGYDPLTPDGDNINSDDANRLASDSWYEDVYATGNDV